MPECRCTIPERIIQASLSRTVSGQNAYTKLQDLRAENFDPGPGCKLLQCPTPDCAKFIVSEREYEKARKVKCPHCSKRFCPRCAAAPHRGQCGTNDSAGELSQLMESEGWRRCPHCGVLCERAEGCQFMTCSCGGSFCYLCGDKLTEEQHMKHFAGFPGAQGPFGSTCQTQREALAHHTNPPRPPPAPQLLLIYKMGLMGERTSLLRAQWEPVTDALPLLEYAVEVSTRPGTWREAGKTEDEHLTLGDIVVVPGRNYKVALRARNVNGWSDLGAESESVSLEVRGSPVLARELSSETWEDVALFRRRPRALDRPGRPGGYAQRIAPMLPPALGIARPR